jgi:hypothetical protein
MACSGPSNGPFWALPCWAFGAIPRSPPPRKTGAGYDDVPVEVRAADSALSADRFGAASGAARVAAAVGFSPVLPA